MIFFLHSIIILSELIGSEKGIFFRLALRARHDYVLPNHTFEDNLTVQEKGYFFFGSRYALTMIILSLINTLSEQ